VLSPLPKWHSSVLHPLRLHWPMPLAAPPFAHVLEAAGTPWDEGRWVPWGSRCLAVTWNPSAPSLEGPYTFG